MENKLIVSLSPHVHGGDSVQKNMYGVLIALIPAFLVSLFLRTGCPDCHGYFRCGLFVLRMGDRKIFNEETDHHHL